MLNLTRQVQIEWGHCDPAGIVFNSRFFEYFDWSTALLFERALGMSKAEAIRKYDAVGIPIVESPERIHLFVVGGHAGRFSAFIPGWGHMSTPVLRPVFATATASDDACADGMCKL